MIYIDSFEVTGGLYCSEQHLVYNRRKIRSISSKMGDRTDYNSSRKALYRLRDKIMDCQKMLEGFGFSVEEKENRKL